MNIEAIIGIVIGAGVAALFGIWQARYLHKLEHRDLIRGLIRSLEGELAVIGELAAVDLDLANIQTKEQGLERLHRVAVARHVFEGTAGDLGILPGDLAIGVVRCYSRLAAKTDAMKQLLEVYNFFISTGVGPVNPSVRAQYEDHQELISTEVDILFADLRKNLQGI